MAVSNAYVYNYYYMKSQWFEYKETAIALRQSGMSMTVIEERLGIPRSTLSGWFKSVLLTDEQKNALAKSKRDAWALARGKAAESHRTKKALRLLEAKRSALTTLDKIELTPETLDLAFAMLYFGEGAKKNLTSIASSDPKILKFVLVVLRRNYGITPDMVRCDLHLRMDQNEDEMKQYWADQLGIPINRFTYVAFDSRTAGTTTYDHYKGVCLLYCRSIAIQRKLIYLYTLFCDKVAELESGN